MTHPVPPTLRMGLLGFSDTAQLRRVLGTRTVAARWQPWPHEEADALWVHGPAARVQPGGVLLVEAAGQPPVRLHPEGGRRPVAYTVLAPGMVPRPPATFDPRDARSIAAVLDDFEARLQPLAAELALARTVAERRGRLQSPVYQLEHRGTLLAVVDTGGEVALAPQARALDLLQCEWRGRPRGAGTAPAGFRRTTLAILMWQLYVRGEGQAQLPGRYRRQALYFRQVPHVPPHLLRDEHLAVLAALQRAPQTAAELQRRLALPAQRLAQALAALGCAAAITTDPAKADPLQLPASPASRPSVLGVSDLGPTGAHELDTVFTPVGVRQPD